ncbi:Serine/threonine-protein phosphatase [Spironucleus salmonicida]|uniref:Serine/threonine-protein phosphatase n=1 Tax=Spironucleus salmonicida TaxID=348837 RepID=V6M3B0_9EUKA|nr:Serine/threonine-protein phosphatase [Spironucleus salmonicida]|eukprot:EST47764.1 Serine/threonine-protein phosphatase [Spironucleus salmonicida]
MDQFQNITDFVQAYNQQAIKQQKSIISITNMIKLLKISIELLSKLPNVIDYNSDNFIAIGDLHGTYISLLEILPGTINKDDKFIFLGDYVDRGFFSVEILYVLLSLLIQYPNNIILLRGNHETESMSSQNGFFLELFIKFVNQQYSNCKEFLELYSLFLQLFNSLPIVCTTPNYTLLHAGPAQIPLEQINLLNRFKDPESDTTDYTQNDPISDIIWSDFEGQQKFPYGENLARGVSITYNSQAIKIFTGDKLLIRSHTCVSDPIIEQNFINIFSVAMYDGSNKASFFNKNPVLFTVDNKWNMDNSAIFNEFDTDNNFNAVFSILNGTTELEFNDKFNNLICSDGIFEIIDQQITIIECIGEYFLDEGFQSLQFISMLEFPEVVCEIYGESFQSKGWKFPRIFNKKLSLAKVQQLIDTWVVNE